MFPIPRIVVSPEKFDKLFTQEARVVELGSPDEESAYETRHSALKTLIRQKTAELFGPSDKALFVNDEWWPDHTQRLEVEVANCVPRLWETLHNLLTSDYRDYRILVSVYADRADSRSHVGEMVIYSDHIPIDRKLFLLLHSTELQRQFAIRLYLWAQSEWDNEIANSFPRLSAYKSGRGSDLYEFMKGLGHDDQITMAQSLLKRAHFGAVEALGETKSTREEELLSEYLARNRFDIAPKPKASARASKKKICSVMAAKFLEAFGRECFDVPPWLGQDPELDFQMRSSGWIISTRFYFGERRTLIHYSHFVTSEMTYEFREVEMPVVRAFPLGITSTYWIGVDSQTEWQYLTNKDVEAACESAIEQCRQFFALAPKLLKGMDLNEIT